MMDAFEAELIGLLPRLRAFALGLALDPAKADDLVQAGCERALSRRSQWQTGTRLDSWMFRILKNLWIDEFRSGGRTEPVDVETLGELPCAQWTAGVEASIALEQILVHLAKLPLEMRTVLIAVCVEDLSYKETAELLEVPIGTVMSRLARARLALHKSVGDSHDAIH
jgi:RNA polymerase sigma-70 factor (ECF subfamily)